ncbi:MAG: hypothetical protein BAJALOKI3v1_60023 [Promethearchaeota archaeon]|nr:MAG: hypothetical protein BAJALOKI3v1_60023 [Candidatus Lokiarchaeota archaeon]
MDANNSELEMRVKSLEKKTDKILEILERLESYIILSSSQTKKKDSIY